MDGVQAPDMPVWHYEQMLAAIYDAVTGAADPRPFPERSWHLDEFLYAVYCAVAGLDDPGCPAPTCRIEEFWLGIYGRIIGDESAAIPTPVWRIEEFLAGVFDAAAEWGGGTELTVTGTAPLTLSNAISHAIVSLTRYGLCTQASTPTPDAPVDIVCNNGALTASKNIFDGGYTLGGTITNSGADGSTNAARLRLDYTLLPPGTYTLSTNGICNNTIVWAYSSATGSGATKLSPGSAFSLLPFTFTLSEAKYVRAMCRNSNNPTLTAENAGAFQIEAGESATAYMAPGLVYASGTPEVLSVVGRQLYDYQTMIAGSGYINSKGSQGTSTSWKRTDYIPVSPGSYTLSGASNGGANTYVAVYDADKVFLESFLLVANENLTFNVSSGGCFVRLSLRSAEDEYQTAMFEPGSTAHAYEKYSKQTASVETLLAVGDYKDEAELISGIKTGKVGVSVYCGSADENWSRLGTNAFAVTNSVKKVGKLTMLCSHYVYTAATSANCSSGEFGCSSGTPRTIYFKNELYDTVDDWRAALAADPIIVVYPLATETTEQTTAQHLVTHKGTNVVDVTANVSPIALEVVYIGEAP